MGHSERLHVRDDDLLLTDHHWGTGGLNLHLTGLSWRDVLPSLELPHLQLLEPLPGQEAVHQEVVGPEVDDQSVLLPEALAAQEALEVLKVTELREVTDDLLGEMSVAVVLVESPETFRGFVAKLTILLPKIVIRVLTLTGRRRRLKGVTHNTFPVEYLINDPVLQSDVKIELLGGLEGSVAEAARLVASVVLDGLFVEGLAEVFVSEVKPELLS